jgi:hypothetical protein
MTKAPLVYGKTRPCMYCIVFTRTDSQCACGAAICFEHKEAYGQICPLCIRLGISYSPVFNPNETVLHIEKAK